MLAAVSDLVRTGRPHAGVELVLTPMEEVGLRGAKAFDTSRLRARVGYCYDHAAPIGNVVLAAPTQRIAPVPLPRPRRALPGSPRRTAAARSSPRPARSPTCRSAGSTPRRPRTSASSRAAIAGQHRAAGVPGRGRGPQPRRGPPSRAGAGDARRGHLRRQPGRVRARDAGSSPSTTATGSLASRPRRAAGRQALEACGREPVYIDSGGGADANVCNARGLACVNLCNGMAEIHTASEHIAASDLDAMLDVTLALIDAGQESVESVWHEDRRRQGDQARRVPRRADDGRGRRAASGAGTRS